MMRALYLPAPKARDAESYFRMINRGDVLAIPAYLSEGACREMVNSFSPECRSRMRVWCVTERLGPDGRIVVADDITARPPNVVGFSARARR
jgi:hypothetical protein